MNKQPKQPAQPVLNFYFTRDENGKKIQKPVLYGGIPANVGFTATGTTR